MRQNGLYARRVFHRAKFETLGSGLFSHVFARPSSTDLVVKVGASLDAWPEYILWAARHGFMGGLAPRVYQFRLLKDGGYMAIMERLQCTLSLCQDEQKRAAGGALAQLLGYNCRYREIEDLDPDERAALPLLGPDLGRFVAAFRERFPRDHGGLDMHFGNIMLGFDGRIVLTDPVAGDGVKDSLPRKVRAEEFQSMALAA